MEVPSARVRRDASASVAESGVVKERVPSSVRSREVVVAPEILVANAEQGSLATGRSLPSLVGGGLWL
jgi:hypothetical protein